MKSNNKVYFKFHSDLAMTTGENSGSNDQLGIYKITSSRLVILLVDSDEKTWNHFFDFVLEWEPKLKAVYSDRHEEKFNGSN